VIVERDVAINVSGGVVLRADVFRPGDDGRYPAILSYGPYGKGLHFADGYPGQWKILTSEHPDVLAHTRGAPYAPLDAAHTGSTGQYMNWEVVDPEKWVPDGYVCVRVDSRGAGRSPGTLEPYSPRETRDLYECIEWAAEQPWCTGKVGLSGISYYAMNAWLVAALRPPHLTAIIAWEGAADFYRDATHHGGILSTFWEHWYPRQVLSVQHGHGGVVERGTVAGGEVADEQSVTGPETLSEDELAAHHVDFAAQIREAGVDEGFHHSRSAKWEKTTVPFLTAANLGGQGLHSRGNFEAFVRAASAEKWLEVHGLEHWTEYYTDYGVGLQKAFFARFLQGDELAWPDEPRVRLNVRTADDGFLPREEHEWPLARTRWTKLYLHGGEVLSAKPASDEVRIEYAADGDGVTFWTLPLSHDTEITGPVAARLFVSSSAVDADLFCALRMFAPGGEEVVFRGAIDPHSPVSLGWLRMSHRALDPELSTEWRPYHTHTEQELIVPGEVYQADVEIWPTSVLIPAGYRIALSVRGRDYEYGGTNERKPGEFGHGMAGCGWFVHDDPEDRPGWLRRSAQTLWMGGGRDAYLLLPVIP
jgi:putative CocE/NonD family hydrolase